MRNLQVLLVDDDAGDLESYARDLAPIFVECGLEATIHKSGTFEEALASARDPHRRFDLILSDTYRGEPAKGDAAVVAMVAEYRAGKFTPVVVFSSGTKPETLEVGPFVLWADKAEVSGIENAVRKILKTGVPQAARNLYDEMDRLAGSYLWEFLEKNWAKLEIGGHVKPDAIARLIRRRAALQIAEIAEGGDVPVSEVHGLEFYLYPPLRTEHLSLGEIVRRKDALSDIRVVLTPTCYLKVQGNAKVPRADYVQLVKTVAAQGVIGAEKIANAKASQKEERERRVATWSRGGIGAPKGRYWFLPGFMDIPHSYCDFMQTDSLPIKAVQNDFESIAVLAPPYAESLQASSLSFNGSVGIPELTAASLKTLLD